VHLDRRDLLKGLGQHWDSLAAQGVKDWPQKNGGHLQRPTPAQRRPQPKSSVPRHPVSTKFELPRVYYYHLIYIIKYIM